MTFASQINILSGLLLQKGDFFPLIGSITEIHQSQIWMNLERSVIGNKMMSPYELC